MTAAKADATAQVMDGTPEVLIPAATALVTREDAGLPGIPAEMAGFTGLEGVDSSAFVIPRIKLVQPTSKEGTPGMYRINLTGDEFATLPIIVVKALQGRTFWNPDPKVEEVLCRSYDFLTPDPSIEKPFSPVCAKKIMNLRKQEVLTMVCEEGKWHGDVRPSCSETYNLLCLQAEDFLPFWITYAPTSIQPVRKYLSAIALRRVSLFMWQTVLSSEVKTEPHKHYIAKFSTPMPMEPAKVQQVIATIMDLGLKDADIKRTLDSEEAVAGVQPGDNEAPPESPGWMEKENK